MLLSSLSRVHSICKQPERVVFDMQQKLLAASTTARLTGQSSVIVMTKEL